MSGSIHALRMPRPLAGPLSCWVALVTALALALFTAPAEAGRDGYRGGHHSSGWQSGGWHYADRGYDRYRGHAPRHYRHDRRHHAPRHFGHRRYHRRDDRNAEFLLGGLVVGALVSHAFQSSHAPERHVTYTTTRVEPPVVTRHYSTTRIMESQPPVGRSLYRDIDGNCFERRTDDSGSELLIELPAAECAW